MSKISKMDAFKTMVEYLNCNKNDIANDIFKIINRSQNQDKKIILYQIILNYKKKKKKKDISAKNF